MDDDPDLWGKEIFGFKVYGPIKDLGKFTSYGDIDMVAIAIPSLSQEKLVDITKMAGELNLHVKILPSFDKLLTNNNVYPEDILVEDLLGRNSVNLENKEVISFIRDKVIMITGAGGSIGSEVCRQLIQLQPRQLLIIDHSEYNLYKICWELENTHKFSKFISIIASVADKKAMNSIFASYKPQIVFHAAAYKHVPLLENQIKQAVKNNFLGTKIVAELASCMALRNLFLFQQIKLLTQRMLWEQRKEWQKFFVKTLIRTSLQNI